MPHRRRRRRIGQRQVFAEENRRDAVADRLEARGWQVDRYTVHNWSVPSYCVVITGRRRSGA